MSDINKKDWICAKCGTQNSEGNFCCECGEPKPAAPQVPAVPAAPAPQAQPKATSSKESEDKKKADLLCVISLLCMFAAPAVAGILMKIAEVIFYGSALDDVITAILTTFTSFGWIAAIVLMIVVRVKYSDNTFGKVLMWLYIAIAIIALIAGIIVLFTVIACVHECNRGMW